MERAIDRVCDARAPAATNGDRAVVPNGLGLGRRTVVAAFGTYRSRGARITGQAAGPRAVVRDRDARRVLQPRPTEPGANDVATASPRACLRTVARAGQRVRELRDGPRIHGGRGAVGAHVRCGARARRSDQRRQREGAYAPRSGDGDVGHRPNRARGADAHRHARELRPSARATLLPQRVHGPRVDAVPARLPTASVRVGRTRHDAFPRPEPRAECARWASGERLCGVVARGDRARHRSASLLAAISNGRGALAVGSLSLGGAARAPDGRGPRSR